MGTSYGQQPPIAEGELVNIRLDKARVLTVRGQRTRMLVEVGDGYRLLIDRTRPNVMVERVAPAQWPPLAGDTWRVAGVKWFAFVDELEEVKLFSSDGNFRSPDQVIEYGAPELVYRDGWTPAPAVAVEEPVEVDERTEYVARLRAVAEFFEHRTDLPAPNDAETFQHTITGHRGGGVGWATDEERFAELRRVAERLGVGVREDGRALEYEIAPEMTYVVYTYGGVRKPEQPEPSDTACADPGCYDHGASTREESVEEAAAAMAAEVDADGAAIRAQLLDDGTDAAVYGPSVPSVDEYERATAADIIAAATDDRGDADRIADAETAAQFEQDQRDMALQPVAARLLDDGEPEPLPIDCKAALAEPTVTHVHRCALYVNAGPHTGNHICVEPRCGRQWNDAGLATALDRLVTSGIPERPAAEFTTFAVSSRDKDRANGVEVVDQLDGVENEAL